MPKYAIAPNNLVPGFSSITPGKAYKISNYDGNGIGSFYIINDAGRELFCLAEGCAHLRPGETRNWELVDELPEGTEVAS